MFPKNNNNHIHLNSKKQCSFLGRYLATRKAVTITIILIFIIAIILVTSSRGGLAYFSPHTLKYKIQSERTIFITNIPIYRSDWKYVDNPLITMLIDEGFVLPQSNNSEQWELIFHWNDSWTGGDGPLYNIFHRYRNKIIEWSRNNRDCARIYWLESFQLLRSENKIDVQKGRLILIECWGIKDVSTLRKKIRQIEVAP